MRHTGGEQHPVAGTELDPVATDLEHGGAGQEGDPLVLVLEVVLRRHVGTAQDLLDDDVPEGEDLLDQLAGSRDVGRRPKCSPVERGRDGLEGVVLADDRAPAPAEAAPAPDAAEQHDDQEDEKEERKHAWSVPRPRGLESHAPRQ